MANVDLTRGHKALVVRDLHFQAALIHTSAASFDDLADLEGSPVSLLNRAFEAQDRQALEGIEALDDKATLAANYWWLLVASSKELCQRANTLRSRSELDKNVTRVHTNDRALTDLTSALRSAGCSALAFKFLNRHAAKRGLDFSFEFGIEAGGAGGGTGRIRVGGIAGHW
jgi:hypothetical protein